MPERSEVWTTPPLCEFPFPHQRIAAANIEICMIANCCGVNSIALQSGYTAIYNLIRLPMKSPTKAGVRSAAIALACLSHVEKNAERSLFSWLG